jgi:hypothetical protein
MGIGEGSEGITVAEGRVGERDAGESIWVSAKERSREDGIGLDGGSGNVIEGSREVRECAVAIGEMLGFGVIKLISIVAGGLTWEWVEAFAEGRGMADIQSWARKVFSSKITWWLTMIFEEIGS